MILIKGWLELVGELTLLAALLHHQTTEVSVIWRTSMRSPFKKELTKKNLHRKSRYFGEF